MKNKFEALTAFQSWPEDWQRLCAEYWAENDKPSGSVTTSLHPLWAELHKQHVEPDAVAPATSASAAMSSVLMRYCPDKSRKMLSSAEGSLK